MHLLPHVQYMAILDGDIMSLLPWYCYECAACVAMPKATNKYVPWISLPTQKNIRLSNGIYQ